MNKIINVGTPGHCDHGANRPFEREERYTVLKISDVTEALDPDECTTLIELEEKIAICRELRGKQPLIAVVVEADWPEYEPTWAAIEQRVKQESLK